MLSVIAAYVFAIGGSIFFIAGTLTSSKLRRRGFFPFERERFEGVPWFPIHVLFLARPTVYRQLNRSERLLVGASVLTFLIMLSGLVGVLERIAK